MTAYRRNIVPSGSLLFTVNLAERRLSLLTDHVEILRAACRDTRQRHPFTIIFMRCCLDTARRRRRFRDALAIDPIGNFARRRDRRAELKGDGFR
ncbi:hypothetical protein [Bradyrhizobium symbiodeficiens]|uniref:hypothetical protein n=1 Tax=Bradyrhizobium symbiodeficiens TaxID=1404367 RepID=UPI000BA1AFD6|nr:hypothetical protein [Bradyrhizobium symbiodeficiens]AWM08541.1 hypothetical protein CIT39_20275 [Bradyrhizobium symbiodeficiens]